MESYHAYEAFITAIMEKTILIVKKRSSKYRPEYRTTNTRLVRLRMLKPCGYASSNILIPNQQHDIAQTNLGNFITTDSVIVSISRKLFAETV